MEKFVFIILHYMNIEDTIECIASIKKMNYSNYEVVIVDNCSPNKTGKRLNQLFNNDKNIHIIISKSNLGFAKGINLGFKYAKQTLNADYICEINNDTIIKQKDFVIKCIEIFKKEKYYIIGPDIVSLIDLGHQNPLVDHVFSFNELTKRIIHALIKLLCCFKIGNLITKILENKKKNNVNKTKTYMKPTNDIILHGCCLIFSPLYIKKFNGLYSKTFMYGEESILFYICSKLNLKCLYIPEIKIFHKEGASTKLIYKDSAKEKFFYKNLLKSNFLLMKLMIVNHSKKSLKNKLQ